MRTAGRAPTKQPKVLEARPLTREDLLHLQPGKPRARTGIVQRFRETHHRIARLIAAGYRNEQVADITGYSLIRIYTLRTDPAFEELIAGYKGQVDTSWKENYDDFSVVSVQNMKDCEQMVAEHVQIARENGELLPLRTLIPLIADRADRFGYGKHSTQTNVNVELAARLERAKLRSGKANVIDAKVIQPTAPGSLVTEHQSPPRETAPQHPSPSEASQRRANLGALLKSRASSMDLRRA